MFAWTADAQTASVLAGGFLQLLEANVQQIPHNPLPGRSPGESRGAIRDPGANAHP